MTILKLVLGPNPIFSAKAAPITEMNAQVKADLQDLLDTLRANEAIGIAGNMVGMLKRLIAIDMKDGPDAGVYLMANPEIISFSKETQEFEEGSLCFPTISAMITRPKDIEVKYLDINGETKQEKFSGFLATVIQHEIDYLNGKIYLNYLSPLKKSMLLKKMQKNLKNWMQHHHVHDENCKH